MITTLETKTQATELGKDISLLIIDEIGYILKDPTGGKYPNFYSKTNLIRLTNSNNEPYVNPVLEESEHCYKEICFYSPTTNKIITIRLLNELASIELLQGLEVEIESVTVHTLPNK